MYLWGGLPGFEPLEESGEEKKGGQQRRPDPDEGEEPDRAEAGVEREQEA